ncbi:MAG: response regulator [Candidatus Neomarinimicrobiota bacterium]
MNNLNERPLEVLLVEDNPGDVLLVQKALKKSTINVNLHIVNDGTEAMIYLKNNDPQSTGNIPNLILLDLNLPTKGGHEVLKEVKGDLRLKQIPIVIVTTSQDQSDIHNCYQNHANCYITKPIEVDDYFTMIDEVTRFWGSFVNLPAN